ncbi:hypothetical protein KY289_035841 [Solanum tuberosum]|nr:hypothetical protein KY289_035841 [Solanum tuberosum]
METSGKFSNDFDDARDELAGLGSRFHWTERFWTGCCSILLGCFEFLGFGIFWLLGFIELLEKKKETTYRGRLYAFVVAVMGCCCMYCCVAGYFVY